MFVCFKHWESIARRAKAALGHFGPAVLNSIAMHCKPLHQSEWFLFLPPSPPTLRTPRHADGCCLVLCCVVVWCGVLSASFSILPREYQLGFFVGRFATKARELRPSISVGGLCRSTCCTSTWRASIHQDMPDVPTVAHEGVETCSKRSTHDMTHTSPALRQCIATKICASREAK